MVALNAANLIGVTLVTVIQTRTDVENCIHLECLILASGSNLVCHKVDTVNLISMARKIDTELICL
jgi:hypothetical protein